MKIMVLALAAILGSALSAYAGLHIGPYIGYGVDLTSVSVPGVASVTNTGGGLGGGLKVGYGLDMAVLGLDFGIMGGYQPLASSKAEVPFAGITTEASSVSVPVMAYIQAILAGPYLIAGIGMDNVTTTVKSVTPYASASSTDSKAYMGIIAGVGYRIPIATSSLEIQGLYHTVMVEDSSDSLVTLSVGYNFGL